MNEDGGFTYSILGKMSSTEHPVIASRSSKIKLINAAAEAINNAPSDKPVTIVSVGSSNLLPEQLIHNQLADDKKSNIRWRCIDPGYARSLTTAEGFNIAKEARLEFGRGKGDARAFSTSSAYLSKTENGIRLIDADKKGSIVVLSIDPPTILPGQLERIPPSLREKGFALQGKVLPEEDLKKANMILITLANNDATGVEMLNASYSSDTSDTSDTSYTTTTIKCHPDKDGKYEFVFGGMCRPPLRLLLLRG